MIERGFKIKKPLERRPLFIKHNKGKEIKVGDRVEDIWGSVGIVISIRELNPINPIVDHGTITVKLLEIRIGTPVGMYDEEHYCHYKWNETIKILE